MADDNAHIAAHSAILLKKAPFRANDLRLTFFTQEHGVISAILFNGAAPNSRRARACQPFSALDIWLRAASRRAAPSSKVSALWHLHELRAQHSEPADAMTLCCGYYLNELYEHLATISDTLDAEPMHALYWRTWRTLTSTQNQTVENARDITLRNFETELLSLLGYDLLHIDDLPANNKTCWQYAMDAGWQEARQGLTRATLENLGNLHDCSQQELTNIKHHHRALIDTLLAGRTLKSRQWAAEYQRLQQHPPT